MIAVRSFDDLGTLMANGAVFIAALLSADHLRGGLGIPNGLHHIDAPMFCDDTMFYSWLQHFEPKIHIQHELMSLSP